MKVTITNDEGEVYTQAAATSDVQGHWFLTDEEGDVLTVAEMFDAARRWEKAEKEATR